MDAGRKIRLLPATGFQGLRRQGFRALGIQGAVRSCLTSVSLSSGHSCRAEFCLPSYCRLSPDVTKSPWSLMRTRRLNRLVSTKAINPRTIPSSPHRKCPPKLKKEIARIRTPDQRRRINTPVTIKATIQTKSTLNQAVRNIPRPNFS